MERPAYNNFPKDRNGRNQQCRDASRRIICKLRGERYRNPGNDWLAKFIQEELSTFDYEETVAWYAETARKLSPQRFLQWRAKQRPKPKRVRYWQSRKPV